MVKVAVLPKEYPKITSNTRDQTTLEDAIGEDIAKDWKDVLQFGVIHFRPGMRLFDCASQSTDTPVAHSALRCS